MTDVGELVVRIRADAAELQRELAKASGSVKEHAGIMQRSLETLKDQFRELIPVITLATLVEFTKGALESADSIYIMAQRIGFAGSTLSALNIPLKQNGSSIDEFSSSMKFMSRNIELASEGNQELIKRFDSLGLSVTRLKALSPEEQFYAIAKALGGVTDQGQLTADMMAILGRGAAGLIPIIRETNGNLKEFTDTAKAAGNALTDEEIHKVHEYEDAWIEFIEHLKIKIVDGVTALDDFMKKGREVGDSMPSFADRSDQGIDHFGNKIPGFETWEEKTKRAGGVTQATFLPSTSSNDSSANGGNADLLTPPKDSELKQYIANLKAETTAIGENERALFVSKAEIEATSKAKEDFNNGLRDSKTLLPGEKDQIDALAGSFYDLKKAQEDNAKVAKQMQEAFANSLADIAVNFNNLRDTATSAIQAIAREIIKSKITEPLSKSIIGSLPGLGGLFGGASAPSADFVGPMPQSSFMDLLPHFASGGYSSGGPMVVGDGGEPEIFNPGVPGTITPMSKLGGGQSVVVNQYISLNPGATEQTVAQLRNLVPAIAAQAHASVYSAMRKGGTESRIAGLRN